MSVVAFPGQKMTLGTLELEFLGARNFPGHAEEQQGLHHWASLQACRTFGKCGLLTLHQSHRSVILFQAFTDKTGTSVDTKHSGSFHVFNYGDEERFLHQTWEWTTKNIQFLSTSQHVVLPGQANSSIPVNQAGWFWKEATHVYSTNSRWLFKLNSHKDGSLSFSKAIKFIIIISSQAFVNPVTIEQKPSVLRRCQLPVCGCSSPEINARTVSRLGFYCWNKHQDQKHLGKKRVCLTFISRSYST